MSAGPLRVGVASERRRLHWRAVPVPLVDVRAQYERLIPQILARFQEVLESGTLILGPNVTAFEEEAAVYLAVPACPPLHGMPHPWAPITVVGRLGGGGRAPALAYAGLGI